MNRHPVKSAGDQDICTLIHQLNGSDPGAAWAAFIDAHAQLIMRAVRQFAFEAERANDCFLHVCEKLCENNFQRLLSFNTAGPAKFQTWLASVLFNLCVDWHRKEYGRATLLPAISALPAFDQAVYRLYFEQETDLEYCRRSLAEEYPGLTNEQLRDAIARVHRVLTPRQRWRAAMGRRDKSVKFVPPDTGTKYPDPTRGPEEETIREERRNRVQSALASLEPEDQLLLQLRYEQGLTLDRIADLFKLGDPWRARRRIQAAMDRLAHRVSQYGVSGSA